MPSLQIAAASIQKAIDAYSNNPLHMDASRKMLAEIFSEYGTNLECLEYLRTAALQQNKWNAMTFRRGLKAKLATYHQKLLPEVLRDYKECQHTQQISAIEDLLRYCIALYADVPNWLENLAQQSHASNVWEGVHSKQGIQLLLQQNQEKVLRKTLENFKSGYAVTHMPKNIINQVVHWLEQHSTDFFWMRRYQNIAFELQIWHIPQKTIDLQRLTAERAWPLIKIAVLDYCNKKNKSIIPLINIYHRNTLLRNQLEQFARQFNIWDETQSHHGIAQFLGTQDATVNALFDYKTAAPTQWKNTHAVLSDLIKQHHADPMWVEILKQNAIAFEIWGSHNGRNGVEKLLQAYLCPTPLIITEHASPPELTSRPAKPERVVTPIPRRSITPDFASIPAAPLMRPPLMRAPVYNTQKNQPMPSGSKKWSLYAGVLCSLLCITFMTPVSAILAGLIIGGFTFMISRWIAKPPARSQPEKMRISSVSPTMFSDTAPERPPSPNFSIRSEISSRSSCTP